VNELSSYVVSPLREGGISLYRGSGDGLAPILLVAAGEALPERLEHEHALKDELDADWAARPVTLTHYDGRMTLVLEDPGGVPLDRLLGQPLDVSHFLRIAIPLAVALRRVHERGLIHKDIKPANILVDDAASGGVWLTGFGIASRLPREHQAPAPPEVIAGTLAYMSPEQTGRMNRSVDSRSDLYSLGVTFYEMLTGALPFTAADPMEWVHCHVARQPAPPRERVADVPGPLSAIVTKLLAKTAEERYQTAAGVEADLRRCLAEWESHGQIEPFPLGGCDVSDRLLIPEKLYGREREIDALLSSFDRVVASGTPELVLVSGYSGIGKSSVINELHKALVPRRGLFASGKFDQYKRGIPYAALAQAIQSLVRSLLSQSEEELGRWRDALHAELGPNGQLMVNLVPELEFIIGKQPPVAELPPQEAQNRFQIVFRRFLGVFANKEHPLALFFDDLQWLDSATLDLLAHLATHSEVRHLLLVGAYRDNEVSPSHPLMGKLESISDAGAKIRKIGLGPLTAEDLRQLIADAVRHEPTSVVPLARLVHQKTAGNPLFAIQFVSALAEEGLLAFDHGATRWSWDLHRIQAKQHTENVVDLMVGKLARLPPETRTALQHLACLGNVARMAMLSTILKSSKEQIDAALSHALHIGLIERQADSYRFIHDRVQEAAYSLIPKEDRAEYHLSIGRLMLSQTPPERRKETIFEIVSQLNHGATRLDAEEREQLAELNLTAARRAKDSTAYASALSYLTIGTNLLPEDSWQRQPELTFAFELNRAECEFLTGALTDAEQRLGALSVRAESVVARSSVACLRIDLYSSMAKTHRAIGVGLDCLRHFGIHLSPHPTEEQARYEYERICSLLESLTDEQLVWQPLMTDPVSLATLDVLTKIVPPAMFTDIHLASLIICQSVDLSLKHGNRDGSSFAYVMLGMMAGTRHGDYQAALRFGQIGYDLVEQRGLRRFQARTYMNFGNVILIWTRHVTIARDLVRRAFEAADMNSDITYAVYARTALIAILLAAGDPLAEVQTEIEYGLAFAKKSGFDLNIDLLATLLALVRSLRGLTPVFGTLDNDDFKEAQIENRFLENPDLVRAECRYWIRKLQARYLAGDHASAVTASAKAQALLWTSVTFETAEYHFYGALSHAEAYDFAPVGERERHMNALTAHHNQLEVWAESCPENFESRATLVAAEIARLQRRELDAQRLYQRAIRSSQAGGLVYNEALSNELAARFYATHDFDEIAGLYLGNARNCYARWGAFGKVRQLEQLHPHLRDEPALASPIATIGAPVEQLDVWTVVKASQALSGEIVLDKLIETLLRIAVEHAGADLGLLILSQGDKPQIVAEATTGRGQVEVTLRQMPVSPVGLPESVLQYVIRTRESVILDDASAQNPFSADQYLCQKHVRSVLCLSLVRQAKLIGVLYLENNLASHVFTPARISVLELLASQAAISLENARLYNDLGEREARIRRLVDSNIIGIMIGDSRGRIIEANEAFIKLLGYDREDLFSGRIRWTKLTPAEWAAADQDAMAQLSATGTCKPYQKEYFRKDGSRVSVLVGGAFFEGKRDEGVVFIIDMTERKRAEEALRESKERFRDYAETASDWLWETGPDHRIVSISEHVEAAGMGSSLRPGVIRWEIASDVESEPEKWRLHREMLDTRQPFRDFVYSILTETGSTFYVRISGKPVFGAKGSFLGYRGTGADVTANIRADHTEEALRKAQLELARAARVTTLGELTVSIAHEVNQPLTAVVANAEACLHWLNRETPDLDAVRRSMEWIIGDGNRASEVIRRVRALANKSDIEMIPLDVNDVVEEVITLLQRELFSHEVSLRTELAPALPAILGDRVQLQQVIINLVMNGIEAMHSVTDRPRELVIRSRQDEKQQVLTSVTDCGVGLSAETADRLFNAFFTTKATGMGMGLSICRSIIEAHSGRLWATANLPHGVIFQFTLPPLVTSGTHHP
jgi:PAS domain S-box-containing protein